MDGYNLVITFQLVHELFKTSFPYGGAVLRGEKTTRRFDSAPSHIYL